MKRLIAIVLVASFVVVSCSGPKSVYKTRAGKQKKAYYDNVQYK